MTAIDKLRRMSRMFDAWHVESEDEDGTIEIRHFSNYQKDPDCLGSRVRELLDEIEAEISERYMPLPLDADGVPIRIGDMLENRFSDYGCLSVHGYTETCALCHKVPPADLETYYVEFTNAHHVKPRTIEDVLDDYRRELVETWACTLDDEMTDAEDEITARYADELRGMK